MIVINVIGMQNLSDFLDGRVKEGTDPLYLAMHLAAKFDGSTGGTPLVEIASRYAIDNNPMTYCFVDRELDVIQDDDEWSDDDE